ncbi:MAG: hypothetical protein R3A47_04965 [Polyangiales bacterium]
MPYAANVGVAIAIGVLALSSGAFAQSVITEPQTQRPVVAGEVVRIDQPKPPPGFWRLGGALGMSGGRNYFYAIVEPTVSYRWIKGRIEPGLGPIYQYSSNGDFSPTLKRHTFGGRVLLRVYPLPQFFVHTEGEFVNAWLKQGSIRFGSAFYPTAFLGGGVLLPMGSTVSML